MISIDETQINLIKNKFGNKVKEINLDKHDRLYITIDEDTVKELAEYVHNELGFKHANFCMGTDLDDKIEVSWYLGNPDFKTILVIRTFADREKPEVPSLRYLWSGMEWHERETFEMLGVIFKDHGDLRKLILPDLWDGYPLRNDYVYQKPSYRKPEDELMS